MKLDYSPLARQVAGLRKHFQGCVFACRDGVNWSYNMLLLVVMQPFFMAWLPLHCSDESATLDQAGDEIEQAECTRSWSIHFSFQLADITYSDVLESASASDTFYITGLSWKGFCKLESVDCLHLLSEAFEGVSLLPSTEKSTRVQTRQSSGSASASSDTTPAWMRMLDTFGTPHQNRIASASKGMSESASHGGGDAAGHDASTDDHTALALLGRTWRLSELVRRMKRLRLRSTLGNHFWEGLGSSSVQEERRMDIKAAAFETNVYQDHGSALSLLWRMRMYHLAQHWDEKGRPELYPLATLSEFTPPEDVVNPLLAANTRVKKRLQAIIRLTPDASLCEKIACITCQNDSFGVHGREEQ
eukprot:6475263-Amphidinium_carterae.2